MTRSSVTIQVTPESKPVTPSWMGEVAAFAQVLTHEGILKAIQDQVRFTHARFGHYDLIDFVAVLIGYVLSGEPTLLAFYERLVSFAEPFMALFGRHLLPHRSTLSRFLAVLDHSTVEACARAFKRICLPANHLPPPAACSTGQESSGWWWMWMEQDKLPVNGRSRRRKPYLLPIVMRDQVCAPGYQRRKRGEVVRTRTVILQAHTHQFLGTFGGSGNGDYRRELLRAILVITSYASKLALSTASVLLRLDGHDARRCTAPGCAQRWPWRDCQKS